MAWQGHRGGKIISELSIVTIYSSIIIVTMLSDWLRSITTQGVQLRTLGFVVVVPSTLYTWLFPALCTVHLLIHKVI